VKAPLGPKRWQNRPVNVSPSLDGIRRVLARQASPLNPDVASDQTAAVAAILREAPAGTDLLFIRRAEHPADPWSGDMAWPGGHVDPGDGGPLATAVREAREELALDLERDGTFLGGLPVVRTHLRSGQGPLWVAPFVFELTAVSALVPNDEVQEAVWVPLPFLLEPSNRGSFIWTRGIPLTMACYRYEGRLIWGLTMKMLDNLLDFLSETGFPR
jgi:8-oxo-dGTP pyrophosphatase MutT (NUDIX family)